MASDPPWPREVEFPMTFVGSGAQEIPAVSVDVEVLA